MIAHVKEQKARPCKITARLKALLIVSSAKQSIIIKSLAFTMYIRGRRSGPCRSASFLLEQVIRTEDPSPNLVKAKPEFDKQLNGDLRRKLRPRLHSPMIYCELASQSSSMVLDPHATCHGSLASRVLNIASAPNARPWRRLDINSIELFIGAIKKPIKGRYGHSRGSARPLLPSHFLV